MIHVMLFLSICLLWFLLVSFVFPSSWYNYRIVRCEKTFYCEKKLKNIGIFWHRMWVDEYLSDEFKSYEAAERQLNAYLTPPDVEVYKYTYRKPEMKEADNGNQV